MKTLGSIIGLQENSFSHFVLLSSCCGILNNRFAYVISIYVSLKKLHIPVHKEQSKGITKLCFSSIYERNNQICWHEQNVVWYKINRFACLLERSDTITSLETIQFSCEMKHNTYSRLFLSPSFSDQICGELLLWHEGHGLLILFFKKKIVPNHDVILRGNTHRIPALNLYSSVLSVREGNTQDKQTSKILE